MCGWKEEETGRPKEIKIICVGKKWKAFPNYFSLNPNLRKVHLPWHRYGRWVDALRDGPDPLHDLRPSAGRDEVAHSPLHMVSRSRPAHFPPPLCCCGDHSSEHPLPPDVPVVENGCLRLGFGLRLCYRSPVHLPEIDGGDLTRSSRCAGEDAHRAGIYRYRNRWKTDSSSCCYCCFPIDDLRAADARCHGARSDVAAGGAGVADNPPGHVGSRPADGSPPACPEATG